MTLHAIAAYVGYRWKAKDLHGVHSPFAYDLNEHVLRKSKGCESEMYKWLPLKYNMLLGRLQVYYNYSRVLRLPPQDEDPEALKYDILLMDATIPGEWISLFNRYRGLIKNNSMVLLEGIHTTKRHTAKWLRLQKHPAVRMSIDLYGVGLLFFKEEIKEKQHLVLKYQI